MPIFWNDALRFSNQIVFLRDGVSAGFKKSLALGAQVALKLRVERPLFDAASTPVLLSRQTERPSCSILDDLARNGPWSEILPPHLPENLLPKPSSRFVLPFGFDTAKQLILPVG